MLENPQVFWLFGESKHAQAWVIQYPLIVTNMKQSIINEKSHIYLTLKSISLAHQTSAPAARGADFC